MRKWKCKVCGYIHEGDDPPEKCPVCGADKSQFVEVTEEQADATGTREPAASKQAEAPQQADDGETPLPPHLDTLMNLITRHHIHPISVHIPNGVIPVAVLFFFLAMLFDAGSVSRAGAFNLIVVFLAMPVVLFTGWAEWRKKYNMARTPYFMIKIACGIVVAVLTFVLAAWATFNPEVMVSGKKWFFLLLNLILLGAAGIAGFIGGKLVFKD
ncbi:MAG: DUF2231 domain-containing protein [Thermodesulfobacteriota bacterium]|nr:DUF2231 domain-containing protein [Thermodesulfobacteriota bacterium]